MGAIQFIENLDRTTLTITDDEFEQHVEAAVSAIAEKHQATSPRQPQQQVFNEKTSLVAGEAATARGSMDGHDQTATPRRSTSSNEHDSGDDKAAITGLLRTIQKPLTTIGRIFSDDGGSSSAPQPGGRPAPTSEHAPLRTSTSADEDRDSGRRPSSRHNLSAEEAAARQASAEAAEAERLHRAEHANVVETLAGMFPDLDKDIISDVVYQKEGRQVVPHPIIPSSALANTLSLELAWQSTPVLRSPRSVSLAQICMNMEERVRFHHLHASRVSFSQLLHSSSFMQRDISLSSCFGRLFSFLRVRVNGSGSDIPYTQYRNSILVSPRCYSQSPQGHAR